MKAYSEQAGAIGMGVYAGGASDPRAPQTPPNPSCFGNIEDVKEMAVITADRVERLVDRMVGAEPSQDPKANLDHGFSGLLNVADDHARTIRGALQSIIDNCNRLEKHLP